MGGMGVAGMGAGGMQPQHTQQQQQQQQQQRGTANPTTKWSTHADESTGYAYYYNNETGESMWEKPVDYDGDGYAGTDQSQQHQQHQQQQQQQQHQHQQHQQQYNQHQDYNQQDYNQQYNQQDYSQQDYSQQGASTGTSDPGALKVTASLYGLFEEQAEGGSADVDHNSYGDAVAVDENSLGI